MKTAYEDTMTMRAARKRYFDVNKFGDAGGYEDKWVDFKIGPIPMPFPNTAGRIRAVRFHDLHHILTDFDTEIAGELEISAWEIAAGCKDFHAAWILNLSGMASGTFLRCPIRTFRAFVRGRHERTTYGEDLDRMLDLSVAEARMRFAPMTGRSAPKATLADAALFGIAVLTGTMVGLTLLAFALPLVPIGLSMNVIRRRATA